MKLQPDYPFFINKPLVFAGFAFKEPFCSFRQAEGVSMSVKRSEFFRVPLSRGIRELENISSFPADTGNHPISL
ncbi:hypothetical protein [Methanosarcina sp. DH2]|uniref:hypothetical protein n=1 Tax=Methanosarcina sp. DH2 TaxID=2605639 RepID=UPI001E5C755F|nr:hypothetical protein [Methanosarcina sp. DH2]